LTGSAAAGRSIAARAGSNVKKSSMELGGSDAFIVLEDADLTRTMPWAVWGRMFNARQTGCAAKRFIAVESIADEFSPSSRPMPTSRSVGSRAPDTAANLAAWEFRIVNWKLVRMSDVDAPR
jgi:acyl-CoA reductase-like NAD-dependent aldehyde dehydrogenase